MREPIKTLYIICSIYIYMSYYIVLYDYCMAIKESIVEIREFPLFHLIGRINLR